MGEREGHVKRHVRVCCMNMKGPQDAWKTFLVFLLVCPAAFVATGYFFDISIWDSANGPKILTVQAVSLKCYVEPLTITLRASPTLNASTLHTI